MGTEKESWCDGVVTMIRVGRINSPLSSFYSFNSSIFVNVRILKFKVLLPDLYIV